MMLQKCLRHTQVTAIGFLINALKWDNMKEINKRKEPKLHKINPVFLNKRWFKSDTKSVSFGSRKPPVKL